MNGEKYARKLAERVETINGEGDEFRGYSPSFWYQLRGEKDYGYENAVLDPGVTNVTLDGIAKRTDAEPDNHKLEHLRHVLGGETVEERWHSEIGAFCDVVKPHENFEYLADILSEDINLFYPDHTENCMYGVLMGNKENGKFRDISEIKEDINTYLPDMGSQVPVKQDFGLKHYRQSEIQKKGLDIDGKDLVKRAYEKIEQLGPTAVITYNDDFVGDVDIDAYPPSIMSEIVKE